MNMKHISLYIAPIFSIILLVLGSGGVSMTLTTVVMDQHGSSHLAIALVSSAFFVGIIMGACQCQNFIFRISHIRAFAALGTLCAAATLAQGLWFNVFSWVFLRFVIGFSLAGLYVVIESWLLGLSTAENRGRVLSVYLVAFYAAQASSQWLLEIPHDNFLVIFVWIALFTALSVIPLAITRYTAPMPESPEVISLRFLWKRTSLGIVGCVISGCILSVIYSFLPKFLVDVGYENQVAAAMFSVILGGTLLQYPIGKLSDIIDRRKVLVAMCIACVVCAIGFIQFYQHIYLVYALCFLLGGTTFTIYPISVSHGVDFVESHRIISAAAVLYIAYGIGSVMGPLMVVPFSYFSPNAGYFIYMILFSLLLAGYAIFRIIRLPEVVRGVDNQFISMPQASFEAQQLDPRAKDLKQTSFDF